MFGCSAKRITDNQAAQIAEYFIIEQGYTNLPVKMDSTRIVPNFGEETMAKSGIIALRYNTLKPNAIFKRYKMGKWTFGFQSVQDSSRYRIVKLKENGKKIWIDHQDVKMLN